MKNKYILGIALVAIMVLSVVAFVPAAMAGKGGEKGNGAPTGSDYKLAYHLNVIGAPNDKNVNIDDTNSNGHRIVVTLGSRSRIHLEQAPADDNTFRVLDWIGTDNDGATLQMPNPFIDQPAVTEGTNLPTNLDNYVYEIYVRALGPPNKGAEIIPGVYVDNVPYYSVGTVEVTRKNGKDGQARFSERTIDLTHVVTEIEGTQYTIPLFSEGYEGFFWDYDNTNELKLLQIRFYLRPGQTL